MQHERPQRRRHCLRYAIANTVRRVLSRQISQLFLGAIQRGNIHQLDVQGQATRDRLNHLQEQKLVTPLQAQAPTLGLYHRCPQQS